MSPLVVTECLKEILSIKINVAYASEMCFSKPCLMQWQMGQPQPEKVILPWLPMAATIRLFWQFVRNLSVLETNYVLENQGWHQLPIQASKWTTTTTKKAMLKNLQFLKKPYLCSSIFAVSLLCVVSLWLWVKQEDFRGSNVICVLFYVCTCSFFSFTRNVVSLVQSDVAWLSCFKFFVTLTASSCV